MQTLAMTKFNIEGGGTASDRTLLWNGFLKSTLQNYLLSARLFSGRFPLGTLLEGWINLTDLL